MSVESRLEKLEEQHRQLDANQHGLAKVCADTKNIALTNQHDIAGLKIEVSSVRSDLAALIQATMAGFKRSDEQHRETQARIDRLELETRTRFEQVDNRFEQVDNRFEQMDNRFEQMDNRFEQMDNRFEQMDKRFDQLELLFRQMIPQARN
ncbi:hypothetical protein [Endozoicomonas sp. ALC020]|uniref:hypothetical protein n=1 Tax=unclassified Endozoicomonas TaxID=2644528 RepID=UPI003BAF0ACB